MIKIENKMKIDKIENKMKIDYLYVGGHKCGSTWIHDMIVQHPEISTPLKKEPNFFNENYSIGLNEYLKLWQEKGIKGEFSTSYFICDKTLKKIYHHNSELKILICLRNPVDRMISHFKHWNRLNDIKKININNYIESEKSVVDRSLYNKHLTKVLSHFPQENIKILFFENIISNPNKVVFDIFDFLQVSNSFTPKNLNKKSGQGFTPKFLFLEKIRSTIFNFLYNSKKNNVINLLRKNGIGRLYRKINSSQNISVNHIEKKYIDLILNDTKKLLKSIKEKENKKIINEWIFDIERKWLKL